MKECRYIRFFNYKENYPYAPFVFMFRLDANMIFLRSSISKWTHALFIDLRHSFLISRRIGSDLTTSLKAEPSCSLFLNFHW